MSAILNENSIVIATPTSIGRGRYEFHTLNFAKKKYHIGMK